MVDNISEEERSKVMQRVRSTSKMEEVVRQALWKRGVRFRKNVKNLKGKPDIAIKKYKLVIFIDSCFWHACPYHGRVPKSNIDFWKKKLERNKERDREVNQFYAEEGWNIKRVWEHELREDFKGVIDELVDFIQKNKTHG